MPLRRLNRHLNYARNRKLDRHSTTMLGGIRRPRPPNLLAEACRLLNCYIRLRKHVVREDPHLYGPTATAYYYETLARAEQAREIDAALSRVYGPPQPGEMSGSARVWSDRYP